MRNPQKETARLLEQPSRECKTPIANLKEPQMNHSTAPCCQQTSPTMSSLEIADLTGKRHNDVLRDIRSTLEQAGIDAAQFCAAQKYNNNNTHTIYRLPRAECDLVVSGYSVKYRWAIIQRWHELEQKVGADKMAPQGALTPDEYRELLEKRGKVIVDRKDYQQWQAATEFGADPYKPYREAAEWVVKLGAKHGRGAAVALLAQYGANHLYRVPLDHLPELVAACKKALGEADGIQKTEAIPPWQAEEITQRIDNLARLFHPHSQPFADVMGIARALRGLDPKLGARAPAFVPLLPDKGVNSTHSPEMSFHDAAILTLRAKYAHGDYKALARDLGIHESSAKKIVGRLALARLDLAA